MRDIKRINNFCDEFAAEWNKYPDLRFGQLVIAIFSYITSIGKDPFYIEESEMIKYIHEYLDQIHK